MKHLSTAIFATQNSSKKTRHCLSAFAILLQGKNPCWEIHVGKRVFRFIPSSKHILEDGLWQLLLYCNIPELVYNNDVNYNKPIPLEQEFGKDSCKSNRADIAKDAAELGIQFRMVTWPGAIIPNMEKTISAWQEQGVVIN